MLDIKKILSVVLLTISTTTHADEWLGSGPIEGLWIYPDYAVVKQGSGGTAPNCDPQNSWSFNWSDFPPAVGNRIMSILLAAHASNATIIAAIEPNECGPENHKKFSGRIHLP